jgi:gliding motility-associated-like protein
MKKITLLLLFLFSSISGFSQLALEGFENTTGPDAFPSTNWTLGTGNWAVFDNGVGSTQSWEINNAVTTPVSVYQGVNAAYVNIENVGAGNTSEEYLATPPVLIPANGVLNFYTRMNTSGNQGTIYQIRVAPAIESQTDPFVYSLVQQWTENELIVPTSNFNIYTEKTVDLSAYANQFVYVSFVKIFSQTGTGTGGDTWFIDNVSIDAACLTPTALTSGTITSNSATLNWTNLNGAVNGWEIEVVLATGTPTGVANYTTTTFPYVVTGLLPNTAYKFYVRARCTTGLASPWSIASANFTTLVAPPVCGGNFIDNGGIAGNYLVNSNVTTTINPTPGDLVTVTFTSFNTESGVDLLKVYDGPNDTSPLLATLSGATIPPAITASSASGSLTFVFTSNNTTNNAGWESYITCGPPPACRIPTAVTASGITINSATLNWTQPSNPDSSVASLFDIIVLPANSAAPTAISVPTFNDVTADAGPSFNVTGLASGTCYDIYVRAVCALNSGWNIVGARVCTLVAPPVCGGNYVDTGGTGGNYAINENLTTVICPVTTGDAVTVTFTAFDTQAGSDILRVYDGDNASGTLLAILSGTTLPPSFTSSHPTGCLTFVFNSNGTTNAAGWLANVTCAPAPACPRPVALTTAGLSTTSVSFGWTPIGSATSWQVIALPCTDPAPTSATTGWTVTSTNPYPFTGLNNTTCYNFYVRSDCGGLSGLSEWAGPQSFTTAAPGLTCAAPITIGSLPYTTTDTTANYGDNAPIEGSPGATGCGSTSNYLNGNDVIYSFTSTFTGTINVAMTPTGTWSGIFAYNSCANIGVNCLAGVANSGSGIRTFDLPVLAGSTYYFVISTWPTPQTTGYTLVINRINCVQPTNATVSGISSNSAQASWGNPGAATSWQVAIQPAGTGVPSGSGVVTATNTNSPLSGLTPLTNYEYYVRADCGDGTFSLWTGPVPFTTAAPPPACGGNFFDAGGPTANYPNVVTDNTTTICPTNPGDVVTVTFTAFETEATWDGLYVFDGNTIGATQIPSANPGGNVTGGLAGSFWGLLTGPNLPGPFTASSASGCLTFRFITDDFGSRQGWSANVTCSPAPNCLKPTTLTATSITSTSALLGWTEPSPTTVTQWEVLVLPFGSAAPLPTTTGGIIISSNPSLITGLLPGTQYTYYVRGICPTSGTSLWSTGFNFTTLIINDNCDGAIFAPVNSSLQCQQITPGTITAATASLTPPIAPCLGTADDDVWFQFIASNTYLNISLLNVVGNTNLNFAVYSGVCGTLTQRYCSAANSLNLTLNGLTLGQTYFIRVYSNANTPQTSTFDLCITTPSTCSNSNTICNLLGENTPSTVGITSLGTIGCLASSPNPTFYSLEVATTGPINLFLSQNALPNGQGATRDVDYAAWGPFTSQAQACTTIGIQAPFAPPGIGVPVTETTGCSFNFLSTETLNIANAQAGQVYIILITNFSQQPGFINLVQTNFGQPGAGTVNCCPEAFFQYQPSSYCKTPGNPNPIAVITPGSLAGVFSSPYTPGLVFANTATGEIDLMASAPGNYVIVNTIPASGSCQSKERTYTINISEPTSATISYSSPSYCKSVTTLQAVTQTGTSGGSYSAIPNVGLSINPTTGEINPSLSSPGVYTVVYGLPGSICTAGNPSTQVEIIALPNIVQPAPIVACNSTLLPALTVGNYYSQSQLTGAGTTPLDISAPITANQTIYVYELSANGCPNEKSFTVTINTVPTPTFSTTASACATATGSVTVTGPVGTSAPTPGSLFISEVTDANTGSLTYVELYNGTGAPVNLANYKLKFYTWGSPPTTETLACNLQLAGTIANNTTNIIKVSSDANIAGIIPDQTFTGCGGVNNNDNIRLTTATADVLVDLWGPTNGSIFTPSSQNGYTYRRLNNATLPSTTWNPADWNAIDPENYGNLGSYSLATSNYEYSIDNGVTYQAGLTFNNLAPGNHILIVKDLITGCLSAPVTIVINALNPTPSVTTFTYVTPVCQNATSNPIPDTSATGFTTGGTFSEYLTTGLVFINATTGEIDLANSTPGSHTIRYSVAFNSTTCVDAGFTDFAIEINSVVSPILGFSYTTPICQNAQATLSPTFVAGFTTGGTFSSTTGLSIDATTGVIDLTTSTAGSYTITYTVAGNSCQASTSNTFDITINPVITPVTTFNYVTPVCQNSTTNPIPNTSAAGFTTGGTYSSNPSTGIDINPTTGEITLANTTSGTYVITYTVAANSTTCQITKSTDFTIVINPIVNPVLGFSYTTPICQNAQATLSPTLVTGFTTGGTFSSTTGLSINGTTGVIDLTTSTSGNYTITYTSNPNTPSCLVGGTNTFNIDINPVITPVTGFGYSSPFCSSDSVTLQLPTLTTGFTAGGTFSSTGGLSLNGTTGEINIPNSTPGVYTITYAIAANTATCQVAETNSTQVIIIPPVTIELTGGCQSVNYILTATPVNGSFVPETASYSWQNTAGVEVGTTQSITVTDVDVYTVIITVDGCSTESLPFDVTSVSCVIQKGISVNNDGLNDTFDLTGFDVKKLTIFNRLGMKVYTRNNYVDEWGGKSDDGDELPDGTYYYVIEQRSGTVKTGWIYINRAQ